MKATHRTPKKENPGAGGRGAVRRRMKYAAPPEPHCDKCNGPAMTSPDDWLWCYRCGTNLQSKD